MPIRSSSISSTLKRRGVSPKMAHTRESAGSKTMKILWVKPGKLLPLDTGGKLRTYNILRKLAAAHELIYLSYYGGKHDPAYEQEVLSHLPGTVCVYTAAPDTTAVERYLDYLRRLPWRAPYAVSKFTATQVQNLLNEWIPQRRFDVAVCDFLS